MRPGRVGATANPVRDGVNKRVPPMQRKFSRQCPHCAQQVTWPDTPTYPFCSERCRLIDLGVWATESYRIPGEPLIDDEEAWSEDAAWEWDEEREER